MPKSKAAKRKAGEAKGNEQANRRSVRLEAKEASKSSPAPRSPPKEQPNPENASSHDSTVKPPDSVAPRYRPPVSPAVPWRNEIYGDGEDPDIEWNGEAYYNQAKYKGCTWIKGVLEPPYAGPERWEIYPDQDIESDFDFALAELWNWVFDYGGEPLEVVEPRLSSADKQRIIDSLGTYCQCSDWDELVNSLPPISRQKLPTTLAECLLNKAMFDNIVQHPFYYVMEPDYEGFEVDGVPTTFGSDLFMLWERLHRAKREKAHHMLTLTVQLMNGFDVWNDNLDDSMGIQSRMLRKSSAIKLATSLLKESSVLSLLMRPIEKDNDSQSADQTYKEKRAQRKKQKQRSPTLPAHLPDDGRFERLVVIFRRIGELATCLHTQTNDYYEFEDRLIELKTFDGKIKGIDDPGQLIYQEVREKMLAHSCSCHDYPDGVLNGRWPVLMVRPMITAVSTDEYSDYGLTEQPREIMCRAQVVLHKQEPSELYRTKQ